jgi:thioredoxin-related protein
MSTPLARRSLLKASGLWLVAPSAFAQTALNLPSTAALEQSQIQAAASGNPLVVLVSLDGCPFCKIVRENYLLPLVREQKLPVVQIDMRSQSLIRDFSGKSVTQDQLIKQWGVRVAPTVLFLGKGGLELADRLKGSYISDFYGSYLESRIAQARKALS